MLISTGGHDGDGSRPDVAAQTLRHTGSRPTSPPRNREEAADQAPAIAVSASAHADPAGPGTTGSTSSRTITEMKNDPTTSTREPNRQRRPQARQLPLVHAPKSNKTDLNKQATRRHNEVLLGRTSRLRAGRPPSFSNRSPADSAVGDAVEADRNKRDYDFLVSQS